MKKVKESLSYVYMAIFATLSALNYKLLVFPNAFAPSGLDGICTMIQYVCKVNIGYLSILANVPLLIAAYFIIDRKFVAKTCVYVLVFSTASVLFSHVNLSTFSYHTQTGTSIVLSPIAAGVIRGFLYVLTINQNGSSGGVDVIGEIVHKYKPYYSMMHVVFIINCAVALASYFVYGFQLEPVICSIVYSFITTSVTQHIQANKLATVKFEIITSNAQTLCRTITQNLKLTATVVNAYGAYSNNDKNMVICVTQRQKVYLLEDVLKDFPDVVVFESTINQSMHAK